MKNQKDTNKNKAAAYPVIYSYIYEREREDINRLAGKFKATRKKAFKPIENKVIISFRIENNKAVPVYDETAKVTRTPDQRVKVVLEKGRVIKAKPSSKTGPLSRKQKEKRDK